MARTATTSLEDREFSNILEELHRHTGRDLRGYARSSLRRRITAFMQSEGITSVTALANRLQHDADCLQRLILAIYVHVTALFRDPETYLAIRTKVVPLLRTYPFIRVWVAGCASGEEAYSLAILLQEEGLYDRTRIYATDVDGRVLGKAATAVFPLSAMQSYTRNYLRAGGNLAFSDYYTANYDRAALRADLKRHILFAVHDLVSDGCINEFHLVMCRNVMIYFQLPLQQRVHRLLHESLATFGVLALGDKESLHFSGMDDRYEALDKAHKLFKKVR
jgi:chemotaxis protein methyltransferase CheR